MLYSLCVRNLSNGCVKSLVSYPCDNLTEFFTYLNKNPSLIPDEYKSDRIGHSKYSYSLCYTVTEDFYD